MKQKNKKQLYKRVLMSFCIGCSLLAMSIVPKSVLAESVGSTDVGITFYKSEQGQGVKENPQREGREELTIPPKNQANIETDNQHLPKTGEIMNNWYYLLGSIVLVYSRIHLWKKKRGQQNETK